jgi:hypothetical protein
VQEEVRDLCSVVSVQAQNLRAYKSGEDHQDLPEKKMAVCQESRPRTQEAAL